jgi:hypothetical protein
MPRDLSNYGPIPEDLASEQDTEPNLFGGQSGDDPTVPRCFMCGRSDHDKDAAFERGCHYALTQMQGLVVQRGLKPDEAQALADWLRSKICLSKYQGPA